MKDADEGSGKTSSTSCGGTDRWAKAWLSKDCAMITESSGQSVEARRA